MTNSIHDTLRAALRGEPAGWSHSGPDAIVRFVEGARYHGVLPLLAMNLEEGGFPDWPREVVETCRDAARLRAIYELADRAASTRVVEALSAARVRPLILKGCGLAYTLYANPVLRPRGDTDLLIPPGRRREAECVLGELGYTKGEATEGEFISYQATWSRSAAFGASHHVDLHWRVNNSQILAKVATYAELLSRAVPVPALGPQALTLCPVDALLFACVHRIGHLHAPYFVDGVAHEAVDRLIWLLDIHLLLSKLSNAELDQFANLAAAKRIRAICLDGLAAAREHLGTSVPPRLLATLDVSAGAPERSACCLEGGKARLMLEDFRALDRWSDRMGWARELAFPPARYMHAKYPDARVRWLPVLYARRGFAGISRLLVARRAGDAR